MTPKDVLQQIVNESILKSTNMESDINRLQVQIDNYQEKIDAIRAGVGDVLKDKLEQYLFETKFTPSEDYHKLDGYDFNQIEDDDGSLTNFKIFKKMNFEDITVISNNKFKCKGNVSDAFEDILHTGFTLETGKIVYSIVSLFSKYDIDTNFTTFQIDAEILTSPILHVWKLEYDPDRGDDGVIEELSDQWEFAHNYITQPLGPNGTYGLQDMVLKLTEAKDLLIANKTKLVEVSTNFSKFI